MRGRLMSWFGAGGENDRSSLVCIPLRFVLIAAVILQACSRSGGLPSSSPRVIPFGQPVPQGGGRYKLGAPYVVNGRRYVPRHDPHYDRVGLGSWYGRDFHGRQTANGEIYDMGRISAAHPTLPLPSLVRVTNLRNGRSLVVRVNDRGPFVPGRIIDLSHRAAHELGFVRSGVTRVRVEIR